MLQSTNVQALEPGIQRSGEAQLPTLVCIPDSWVRSPPFPMTTSLWHWSLSQTRQSLCLHFRPFSQVSNNQVRHSYLPSFAFQALESDLHLFQRQHPCDHSFRNGGEVITAIYAGTGATVVNGDGHVTCQDKRSGGQEHQSSSLNAYHGTCFWNKELPKKPQTRRHNTFNSYKFVETMGLSVQDNMDSFL